MRTRRRGAYPGSFNPPTVAHVAIARAAQRAHELDEVVWIVSEVALAKEAASLPRFVDRMQVLAAEAARHPWLSVATTRKQLVADISAGYDVVIMGADKWEQIHDVAFYTDIAHRDRALASLPTIAVAPRAGFTVPPALRLDIDPAVTTVSSTLARDGAYEAMSVEARRFDRTTGAWTDPDRYRRWLDDRS